MLTSTLEEVQAQRTCIGHGKDPGSMWNGEGLIGEVAPIDAATPCAIASLKVSTLQHKVLNDAMEAAALVAKALLARGCTPA